MMRSRCIALMTLLVALVSAPAGGLAQTYPDRPVKIVVPIGPAGSYDILGRVRGRSAHPAARSDVHGGEPPRRRHRRGHQGGDIVAARRLHAPGGGLEQHRVQRRASTRTSPMIRSTDLVPVALVLNISYTLVGSNSLPYATPKEIIAAAKKNPGALKLANAGVGTGQHIVGAAFQAIERHQVPGGRRTVDRPLAFPDLLGGRVDLFFDSTPAALAIRQVRSGKGHRHSDGQAKPAGAGGADHDRVRRARLRDRFLDRDLCAGTRRRLPSLRGCSGRSTAAGPEMKPALAKHRRRADGDRRRPSSSDSSGPTMIAGSRSSRTPG